MIISLRFLTFILTINSSYESSNKKMCLKIICNDGGSVEFDYTFCEKFEYLRKVINLNDNKENTTEFVNLTEKEYNSGIMNNFKRIITQNNDTITGEEFFIILNIISKYKPISEEKNKIYSDIAKVGTKNIIDILDYYHFIKSNEIQYYDQDIRINDNDKNNKDIINKEINNKNINKNEIDNDDQKNEIDQLFWYIFLKEMSIKKYFSLEVKDKEINIEPYFLFHKYNKHEIEMSKISTIKLKFHSSWLTPRGKFGYKAIAFIITKILTNSKNNIKKLRFSNTNFSEGFIIFMSFFNEYIPAVTELYFGDDNSDLEISNFFEIPLNYQKYTFGDKSDEFIKEVKKYEEKFAINDEFKKFNDECGTENRPLNQIIDNFIGKFVILESIKLEIILLSSHVMSLHLLKNRNLREKVNNLFLNQSDDVFKDLSSEDFNNIYDLNNVRHLVFLTSSKSFFRKVIKKINSKNKIKHLSILNSNCLTYRSIKGIENFINLESLSLEFPIADFFDISLFELFLKKGIKFVLRSKKLQTSLKELKIKNFKCLFKHNCKSIARFKKLERLSIQNSSLFDESSMSAILKSKYLQETIKKLDFCCLNLELTYFHIYLLEDFKNLKYLDLRGVPKKSNLTDNFIISCLEDGLDELYLRINIVY
ncbi:hypothetical protein DMUE_3459 [Dictyocoela muelleri]|nr:hypothetical protein DMUE_3459 [Dictyocoela muelleri]